MTDQAMRVPQQDRSRKTLERIVETSIEILREHGWDAVTVGEVERRSGVSRGAFYTRFPTRDALIAHVAETVMERVAQDQTAALGAAQGLDHSSLAGATCAAVSAVAQVFRLHGSIFMKRERPRDTTPTGMTAIADMNSRFAAILDPFLESGPDSRRAVEFVMRTVFDSLAAHVHSLTPFTMHQPLEFDEHVECLVSMSCAYLAQYEARG